MFVLESSDTAKAGKINGFPAAGFVMWQIAIITVCAVLGAIVLVLAGVLLFCCMRPRHHKDKAPKGAIHQPAPYPIDNGYKPADTQEAA